MNDLLGKWFPNFLTPAQLSKYGHNVEAYFSMKEQEGEENQGKWDLSIRSAASDFKYLTTFERQGWVEN